MLLPERRLLLAEWIVLAFGLLAVVLYYFFDIEGRFPLLHYGLRLKSGLIWYSVGVIISCLCIRLSDISAGRKVGEIPPWQASWGRFQKDYLSLSRIVHDLRLVHIVSLMFVVFVNLKHLIPLVNSNLYDTALARFEYWAFGGKLASQYFVEWFGAESAWWMSEGYTAYYIYVALVLYYFILQRKRALAEEFCAAFVLMWFLGILVVYLYPTWGPCFSSPELFSALPYTEVAEMQARLWKGKLFLDVDPKSAQSLYLISGLPSLHVSAVVLGSLYLQRVSALLAALSWLFVVLTLVTTIYFGWHFVLDDVASFLLVYVVIRFVRPHFR